MQAPSALTDKVRRLASWLAVILACLSLATAFFSPVSALVHATLLFVLAFAVRKGGSGPALALGGFFLLRAAAMLPAFTREGIPRLALAMLLPAAYAGVAFWAAWLMWDSGRPRRVVPWMLGLGLYGVYIFWLEAKVAG